MRCETLLLPAEAPSSLKQAVALVQRGELVAFPTDTVYGVGVVVWDQAAVGRLYWAKRRPANKAIPVLLAETGQLSLVAASTPEDVWRLAERFWPGPLTLVVPCSQRVPNVVTAGGQTVAVRVPDHPIAQDLIRRVGEPLAATSANLSGQPSPLTAQEVVAQLGGRIALVLDGGACPGGVPSTVVDLTGEQPRLLRAGPIAHDIAQALGMTTWDAGEGR